MLKRELLMKLGSVFESTKPKDCKKGKIPPSARNILITLLAENELNQRALAKRLNITAQGVCDTVKKLETIGLIIKENGEAYNEKIVKLTDEGKELAREIDIKTTTHAEEIFADFTDEDVENLYNLLEKIKFYH